MTDKDQRAQRAREIISAALDEYDGENGTSNNVLHWSSAARQFLAFAAERPCVVVGEKMHTAVREAIALIDEINERKPSREFNGINDPLSAKLHTIRATLAHASLSPAPVKQSLTTGEVTQADRDQAGRIYQHWRDHDYAGWVKNGQKDSDWIVQAFARHRLSAPPIPATGGESFQARVQPWLMECFGAMIAGDREERNHRFLEEALELVQSCDCTASEAHQLVDYVYGRPVGELHQEVGGVMVTLAALCLANDADMHAAGWVELDRIWGKVEAIRAKQAAKPKHSPLPAALSPTPVAGGE